MLRTLQPELLDSLPHDHPDALHSRRDLRWINAIMGNHRWILRTVPRLLRTGEHALELGAGHGELGHRLLARGVAVDGLDLAPRPPGWPVHRAWHVGDLRAFDRYADYEAVVANLILHHLSDGELAALGDRFNRSPRLRLIVANEPHRSRSSQRLIAAVSPLFGASHVTRHDAHVSIAAGFRDWDLPHLLGLDLTRWTWCRAPSLLGAYRMIAMRSS